MRRLRVVLAFAAAVCLVLVAGCGGGDKKPVSPLDDALGYFSKDAPFVAAVETDPNGPQIKQLTSLIGRPPGSQVIAIRLQNLTRLHLVDWNRDVRPQLGAPLVFGLAKPAAGRDLPVALVVAMRIKHPLKAKQVLLRQPGYRGRGKSSGARIYENMNESRYLAVDGDVLVAATNREILAHALALKRTDNRMRAAGFQKDVGGLPSGGLLRVSADPRQMLGADPRLRPALTVKWIAALRRLGSVVKASTTGLSLDLKARTDGGALSDADLPLSPQPAAVPLVGAKNELQIGVRDPARLARLAFAFWHAVAPARAAALDALEPRGIDLQRQVPH